MDTTSGFCIGSLRRKTHLAQEQIVVKLGERGIVISRSIYSQIKCCRYNIRVSEPAAFSEIFGVDYNAFFKTVEMDRQE